MGTWKGHPLRRAVDIDANNIGGRKSFIVTKVSSKIDHKKYVNTINMGKSEALLAAVMAGDLDTLKRELPLMTEEIPLESSLLKAAVRGDADIVRFLLSRYDLSAMRNEIEQVDEYNNEQDVKTLFRRIFSGHILELEGAIYNAVKIRALDVIVLLNDRFLEYISIIENAILLAVRKRNVVFVRVFLDYYSIVFLSQYISLRTARQWPELLPHVLPPPLDREELLLRLADMVQSPESNREVYRKANKNELIPAILSYLEGLDCGYESDDSNLDLFSPDRIVPFRRYLRKYVKYLKWVEAFRR